MRGDNVEAILVADRDLNEVVRDHPELSETIPELHLTEAPVCIEIGVHGSARPEGISTERYLRAEPVGAVDDEPSDWEPEQRALLERLGPFTHVFYVEATSAPLTCELICALAPHCRLAVDNDFGGILGAAAFCALDRAAQVDFIQAKYSEEAVARRSEIAHGARRS